MQSQTVVPHVMKTHPGRSCSTGEAYCNLLAVSKPIWSQFTFHGCAKFARGIIRARKTGSDTTHDRVTSGDHWAEAPFNYYYEVGNSL